MSLFVPGFGLIRGGRIRRGVYWLVAMQLISVIAAASIALSMIPMWLPVCVLGAAIVAQVWMLWESFRPGRMTGRLWLLFIGLLAAIALIPPPAALIARAFRQPTSSMEPTLRGTTLGSTPDHLIVDRMTYRFTAPKRGDIIAFDASKIPGIQQSTKFAGETFFLKRIVGLPGERIRIEDGRILADGRLLDGKDGIPPLSYLDYEENIYLPSFSKRDGQDHLVGPEEYFVLGDHSANSYDSRYWGCVPAHAIHGKATTIYYPLGRAGRISTVNPVDIASEVQGEIRH